MKFLYNKILKFFLGLFKVQSNLEAHTSVYYVKIYLEATKFSETV